MSKDPSEKTESEVWFEREGFAHIKVWLEPQVRQNYQLVSHHYGLSQQDLIEAAPWMFTLLAAMSLAYRKERLAEASTAFNQAVKCLPDHLDKQFAGSRFDETIYQEGASIAARDIFGRAIPDSDPGTDNPFIEFLCRTAEEIGSNDIDSIDCWLPPLGNRVTPTWPLFTNWVDELVGDDYIARRALREGYVQFKKIPQELMEPEKQADLAAWLIDQLPTEKRERLEKENEAFAALAAHRE